MISTAILNVLVCGATGNQGSALSRLLLARGHRVRALTRGPQSGAAQRLAEQGAQVFQGSFANEQSLRTAMKNMDCVFLMGTPYEAGIEAEIAHAKHVIDVAEDAKIAHLVFSSGGNADQATGIPHFDSKYQVEQYLCASSLSWTILGPVFFKENFLSPLWLPGLRNGQLAMALPSDRMIQMISMDDIAAFAVAAFENRHGFAGLRLDLASDELSGAQVVRILTRLSGRSIDYVELPLSAMRALGEDFAIMFEWFDRVGYGVDIADLRRRHAGIELSSFAAWAERIDWRTLLAPN